MVSILETGHKLRVSASRVLRTSLEHERKDVTGEWIKLYNELYNLYIIKYYFSSVVQQTQV
jgi:hypothetical protein